MYKFNGDIPSLILRRYHFRYLTGLHRHLILKFLRMEQTPCCIFRDLKRETGTRNRQSGSVWLAPFRERLQRVTAHLQK